MRNLTNANLTGADLRGAQGFVLDPTATTANTIFPDGTIQGLNLNSTNPTLLVRNYSGSSSIPIHILQGMSMNPGTSLVFQFDGNPWGSTISFDAGIPVTLGGNIELGLAPGTNPTGLLGQSIPLFDWTGVSPSGQFAQVVSGLPTRYLWNTSALYTLGQVALTLSATSDQRAVGQQRQRDVERDRQLDRRQRARSPARHRRLRHGPDERHGAP